MFEIFNRYLIFTPRITFTIPFQFTYTFVFVYLCTWHNFQTKAFSTNNERQNCQIKFYESRDVRSLLFNWIVIKNKIKLRRLSEVFDAKRWSQMCNCFKE